MSLRPHLELMAHYNQWMNTKILLALKDLNEAQLWEDRRAFFGSIMGTLNHILGTDLLWLERLAHLDKLGVLVSLNTYPIPKSLDSVGFKTLTDFSIARQSLDQMIIDFVATLDDQALNGPITYTRLNGETYTKQNCGLVISHVFNHQTHHRGQLTTLLSQMGIDVGVTDLAVLVE